MVTSEEFLLSLPQPIAVVGNGPCSDQGVEIDGHASVIRINNFILNGFFSHVGRRLSAWCVNCWKDVPWRELGVPVFTLFHVEDDGGRILHWEGGKGARGELLQPSRRWSEEVRVLKPRKPSTGLLLLFALHSLEIPASVYGFDGLEGGHYWNSSHQHDHPSEVIALKSLAEGSIRISPR